MESNPRLYGNGNNEPCIIGDGVTGGGEEDEDGGRGGGGDFGSDCEDEEEEGYEFVCVGVNIFKIFAVCMSHKHRLPNGPPVTTICPFTPRRKQALEDDDEGAFNVEIKGISDIISVTWGE